MTSIAKGIKRLALRTARAAGAFEAAAKSIWRQRRLTVLCYHGVSIDDEHVWSPSLFVSQQFLRRRMELLRKWRCTVLSLDEALVRLRAETLPERAVVLTFDDGLADFNLRAYPILEEFQFPATVYLTTFYCGRPAPVYSVFWPYALWKTRRDTLSRELIDQGGEWDISTPLGRERVLSDLRNYANLHKLDADAKDELSGRLAEASGLDYECLRRTRVLHLVEPQEVAELSQRNVAFELHTHRHRTPNDKALFGREVHQNRNAIMAMTGRPPMHFCYPSGVFRTLYFPWLRDNRVASATTCVTGIAGPSENPYLIPRIVDSASLDEVEFESWICGAGAFLPLRTSSVVTRFA